MSERAVQSILRTQLKLGASPSSQPGPLIPRKGNLRESEISADTFTYSHVGVRTLAPAKIHATVAADHGMTRGLYSGKADVARVLTGHAAGPRVAAAYVTALASFFNTITPGGIIIHHSATLPSNNRVPTNAREVDLFHKQR